MSNQDTARQWINELTHWNPENLSGKQFEWLNQARQRAKQQIATMELPHRKTEKWRYTSIDRLVKTRFEHSQEVFDALQATDIDNWIIENEQSYRLVFANGHCIPRLCNIEGLTGEIKIGSLRAAMATDGNLIQHYLTTHPALRSKDIFTALNEAYINDGLFVHVPENIKLDKPIEVMHINLSVQDAPLILPRHLVILEQGSQATLVEQFSSTGDSVYFANHVNELFVNDNAQLTHYRVQNESTNAHHLSGINLLQGANSHYDSLHVALGANWSRNDIDVQYSGKGAHCELNGLYWVNNKQLSDFHLNVEHNQSNCSSVENFRGILSGKGRAVFDGRILVARDAQKTDAHLTNKNLVLSRDAEVDTKPQLEIYADDVKCSHGTTVGQIDPRQVFYMRSRGIDETAAKKMLCLGFAGEILEKVKLEDVKSFVEDRISQNILRG